MRLLIAEDDSRLLKSLIHIFKADGYVADGVENGDDALYYAKNEEYDGYVFDIMMPSRDGISVLKELRKGGNSTPCLFLTAKTEIQDRVEGLDAGADDYLPKPFATEELLARVRAMLRRKDSFVPDLLKVGEITLNRSTYELSYKNKSTQLSGKEFAIVELLLLRKGSIVSSEQFIENIWGYDTSVDTSVIWVHISNIRKKIEAIEAPLNIKFIRGAGYVAEVEK